ncbi:MAG: MGMT family protein [Patescibacteria group bacterium]
MKNLFADRVRSVVAGIAKGSVMTYREVAKAAGSANAFRAVGSVLKQNYDPKIPCHRVIRSDGKAGEYNRGAAKKVEILLSEGVLIHPSGTMSL